MEDEMNLKSNLKSFIILALLLQLIIIMLILKSGVTMLVLAVGSLVLAMLLSVNRAFYERFSAFLNPGFYRSCGEKGSSLYRKKRRYSTMNFYILAILALNGYRVSMLDSAPGLLAGINQFISFALVAFVLLFIIVFFSIILIKSSDEDLLWNMFMGILFIALSFIVYFSFL
ncbi:hypothetical protein [Desulfitobacterium hafniense]|uniref:hypothetical protein n=1 Tax=Desulfitobacterium hafniense TaxID=49338 RepID=UPI000376459E|nr:hypothetical protein [Desulfitobacterium hafniense]